MVILTDTKIYRHVDFVSGAKADWVNIFILNSRKNVTHISFRIPSRDIQLGPRQCRRVHSKMHQANG